MKRAPIASIVAGIAVLTCANASAQDVPWDTFADTISDSVCSVVNASNAELVVLSSTGELVIVSGPDLILGDTFVDADGFVFFENALAGFLDFATDDDGFRTLWWLTLTGTVVDVDTLSGEPFDSGTFPDEYFDVPCDACDFWDDAGVCDEPPVVVPPINVSICGTDVLLATSMSLVGLMGLGSMRRRTAVRP